MGNLKSGISSQLVQCLYTALTAEVDRSCVSIRSLKGLYKVSIRVGVLFCSTSVTVTLSFPDCTTGMAFTQ